MIRKLCCLLTILAVTGVLSACAENDVKTTTKTESKTESEPRDVSPGQDVVR